MNQQVRTFENQSIRWLGNSIRSSVAGSPLNRDYLGEISFQTPSHDLSTNAWVNGNSRILIYGASAMYHIFDEHLPRYSLRRVSNGPKKYALHRMWGPLVTS